MRVGHPNSPTELSESFVVRNTRARWVIGPNTCALELDCPTPAQIRVDSESASWIVNSKSNIAIHLEKLPFNLDIQKLFLWTDRREFDAIEFSIEVFIYESGRLYAYMDIIMQSGRKPYHISIHRYNDEACCEVNNRALFAKYGTLQFTTNSTSIAALMNASAALSI